MASGKVARRTAVGDVAELLDSPEIAALIAERFGRWYREAKARGISMCVELHGGGVMCPAAAAPKE